MAFHFIMMKFTKIKENYIFRRAYKKAKSVVSPYIVVYILRNNGKGIRLGITAGKKIGKAVCRNRAKRLIFAAFSQCAPYLSGNYDFVIVARTRILTVKSGTVYESLKKLLKGEGLISNQETNE